jgi:predicted Zn-dependent protease
VRIGSQIVPIDPANQVPAGRYPGAVTAALRVRVLVAAAALAAAGAAVGVTLATRTPTPSVQRPKGAPPLSLDLGLRTDAQAQALRQASSLYAAGKRAEAGRIFSRYSSLEAQVGAALSTWPTGTVAALEGLANQHPKSAVVQLNLGLAQIWNGDGADATSSFRAAERAQPDTTYAVEADSLLHPRFYRGLPPFTPSMPLPESVRKLPAPQQLAALRRLAGRSVGYRLLYGAALQGLGRPVSAERQFVAAAAAAPDDPDALTAAAVGRFSKSNPSAAFSRLGPLTQRFPHAAVVRFHLGLMLVWMAQTTEAKKQFRLAVADDPRGVYGVEAKSFLERLGSVGTK